ncbi:MAG: hypothetical protein IJ973_07325, partial [Christensenellaceae bacterium]|nr:hypothetical protein [Christensenellaceae bacterium]
LPLPWRHIPFLLYRFFAFVSTSPPQIHKTDIKRRIPEQDFTIHLGSADFSPIFKYFSLTSRHFFVI